MKRIMMYTAVVMATLLSLAVLWQFRLVLLLFVLSLFMAATIRPFVNKLVAWGFSKATAQLLLYMVVIGGFFFFFLLAGDLLLLELNITINRVVIEYESVHRQWQHGASWQQTAVSLLPPPFSLAATEDVELEQMLPMVVNITRGITSAVGSLLLLLALSTYWSADQNRFERLWLSLLPTQRRAYARDSWREIETAVGSYLRSQLAQSGLAGLLFGIGAAVMGMDTPLLWASLGALAAFVPLFGGLLTAIVAFGLGSLESVGLGVGAAFYTLIIFLGLDLFIEPRLWPRQRRGFLLTILIIIPFLEAFGFWGLIIAPPLSAAIEVLLGQMYQASMTRQKTAVQLDDLETRFRAMMQKTAQAEYGDVTPELRNLATRLADLLNNSRNMETG